MELKTRTRMSKENRKRSIIEACLPLFVKKGFASVTTKELASAADVSEALLYKHFPSKKEIYRSIQSYCCSHVDQHVKEIEALPTSTETLIHLVELFIKGSFPEKSLSNEKSFSRLMFNSLLEDGEFARMFLETGCNPWRDKVSACLKYALAEGDVSLNEPLGDVVSWFIHHLHVGAIIMNMPSRPIVDYGCEQSALTKSAIRFCLRGLGLKEELLP